MRPRSVAARLAAAFGALALLLALVGSVGVAGLVANERSERQLAHVEQLADLNVALLVSMTNAETGLRGYSLGGREEFLEPYTAGRTTFPSLMERAIKAADDERTRALLADEDRIASSWFAGYADRVTGAVADADAVSPSRTLWGKRTFDQFRRVNSELDAHLGERRAAALARTRDVEHAALGCDVAAALAALVVGILVARWTTTALRRPLKGLSRVVAALTAGHHDARVRPSGPREVRRVAEAVNALADESDRLRNEQSENARLLIVARDLGRRMRDSRGATGALEVATAGLGPALDADRVQVRLVEGATLGEIAAQWTSPGTRQLATDSPAALASGWEDFIQAPDFGQVRHVDDLTASAEFRGGAGRRFVELTGARTFMSVAVTDGTHPVGVLTVIGTRGPRTWKTAETSCLESVAADVGRALHNIRLFEQQQELVDQLFELDRTKTDFLSTVSHELRTPLTSISGYIELLDDGDAGPVTDEQRRMLAVVERNTSRLKALIEDLLTLSRIEAGAFKVSKSDVALDALVDEAISAIGPQISAASLRLGVDLERGTMVLGEANQLERVVLNLVSNAVKFTPPGGELRVRVRSDGHDVVLEVSDSGIGIPVEEQERLFTRFFRATNATERAIQGTGLGLVVVRSIVEHHGGRLDIVSSVGRGTTVRVRLPRLEVPAVVGSAR